MLFLCILSIYHCQVIVISMWQYFLQIILIFVLALVVAYLVGLGVEFSTKSKLSKMGINVPVSVTGSAEIDDDIETFRQLGGPDVIADAAAIEEFADRLMIQLENMQLDDLQKLEYAAKINDLKNELLSKL